MRTVDGHALIANDPHLILTIPGIWYVVDIESPQMHAAGATIPGIPGVLLGHNERLAWALTNAEMATTSVFEAGHLNRRHWVYRRGFACVFRATRARPTIARRVTSRYPMTKVMVRLPWVRWPIYAERRSTIATVLALDRARDINAAIGIIANYRGSPQNFILADRSGKIAYHVAGLIPDDPAWGRYVHPRAICALRSAPIPFRAAPRQDSARDVILASANNKAYTSAYPYRLSAQFEPPYRAYRIAELLHSRPRYDAAYFARMQLDTLSPIDLEIARDVVRFVRAHPQQGSRAGRTRLLGRWNGRYEPDSQAAALEHMLRVAVLGDAPELARGSASCEASTTLLRATSIGPRRVVFLCVRAAPRMARGRRHADRASARADELRVSLTGRGSPVPETSIRFTCKSRDSRRASAQYGTPVTGDRGSASRFRAGESGEPGSPHYTDLTRAWVTGRLQPLPLVAPQLGGARPTRSCSIRGNTSPPLTLGRAVERTLGVELALRGKKAMHEDT